MLKVLQVSSDTNIGGAGKCILTYLKAYTYLSRSRFGAVVKEPYYSLKYLSSLPIELGNTRTKKNGSEGILNGAICRLGICRIHNYRKICRSFPRLIKTPVKSCRTMWCLFSHFLIACLISLALKKI